MNTQIFSRLLLIVALGLGLFGSFLLMTVPTGALDAALVYQGF